MTFEISTPLSRETLDRWKQTQPPSLYTPGQALFYRNHIPYGVYVIHSGTLVLSSREEDHEVRTVVGAGQIVGLDLLLNGDPYPATATASEPVTVSFMERSLVVKAMEDHDPLFEFVH